MNQFFDNFVRKTLWIWLPFYALYRLSNEIVEVAAKKAKK